MLPVFLLFSRSTVQKLEKNVEYCLSNMQTINHALCKLTERILKTPGGYVVPFVLRECGHLFNLLDFYTI